MCYRLTTLLIYTRTLLYYLPLAETVNSVCFLAFFLPPPCPLCPCPLCPFGAGSNVSAGGVVAPHPTGDVCPLPRIREISCAVSDLPNNACRSAVVSPLPPLVEGKPGKAAAEGGLGAFFWPLTLVVE